MSPEALIRTFYDARARGDRAGVRQLLADDVRWHDPYPPPHGGDLVGADVIDEIIEAAGQLTGGSTRLVPQAVIADGVLVAALVRWSSTMHGRTMEGQDAAVYNVVDGHIVEAWFHPGDHAASDAFFT